MLCYQALAQWSARWPLSSNTNADTLAVADISDIFYSLREKYYALDSSLLATQAATVFLSETNAGVFYVTNSLGNVVAWTNWQLLYTTEDDFFGPTYSLIASNFTWSVSGQTGQIDQVDISFLREFDDRLLDIIPSFVDHTQAGTNGTFDEYFATPTATNWSWSGSLWSVSNYSYPSDFPYWTVSNIFLHTGVGTQLVGSAVDTTPTTNVFYGWQVGQLSTYQVTNVSSSTTNLYYSYFFTRQTIRTNLEIELGQLRCVVTNRYAVTNVVGSVTSVVNHSQLAFQEFYQHSPYDFSTETFQFDEILPYSFVSPPRVKVIIPNTNAILSPAVDLVVTGSVPYQAFDGLPLAEGATEIISVSGDTILASNFFGVTRMSSTWTRDETNGQADSLHGATISIVFTNAFSTFKRWPLGALSAMAFDERRIVLNELRWTQKSVLPWDNYSTTFSILTANDGLTHAGCISSFDVEATTNVHFRTVGLGGFFYYTHSADLGCYNSGGGSSWGVCAPATCFGSYPFVPGSYFPSNAFCFLNLNSNIACSADLYDGWSYPGAPRTNYEVDVWDGVSPSGFHTVTNSDWTNTVYYYDVFNDRVKRETNFVKSIAQTGVLITVDFAHGNRGEGTFALTTRATSSGAGWDFENKRQNGTAYYLYFSRAVLKWDFTYSE